MKRIFIAINLPDKIKAELEDLQKQIVDMFPQDSRGVVRWLKKDNLHLTLLFIGSVKEEKIPCLCDIIKEVVKRQISFFLKIKRVCYGPPKKIPPRLIWLELDKNPELLKMVSNLKREVSGAGVLKKIEKRPFSPHITLARIKAWQWRRIEPEDRPEIEKELDLTFNVNSIELMESKLKRTGAEYKKLSSFKLQVL